MTAENSPKENSCEAGRLHRVEVSFVEVANNEGENSSAASSKGIKQLRVKLVHKSKDAIVGETKFSWPEDVLPHQISYDSSLGILEMKSQKNIAKLPLNIPKASIQIGLTKSTKAPNVVSWDGFSDDRKQVNKVSAVEKAAKVVVKKGYTVASWKALYKVCQSEVNGSIKVEKFDLVEQKVLVESLIAAYKDNKTVARIVLQSLIAENIFGSQLSKDLVEEFCEQKAFDILYDFLSFPPVIVNESVFVSTVKLCLANSDDSQAKKIFGALMKKNFSSRQLTHEVRDQFTIEEVIAIVQWCSEFIIGSSDTERSDNLFPNVIELIDIMVNAYSQQLMWDTSAKEVIQQLRDYISTTITVVEQFTNWNVACKLTKEFPELDGEPPCDYVIRKATLSKRVI